MLSALEMKRQAHSGRNGLKCLRNFVSFSFHVNGDKIFDSLCMIIEHAKKKINSLKMFFTNKQSLTQQTQHCCQLKRTNSRRRFFFLSRLKFQSFPWWLRYFWLLNNKARPFRPFYTFQTPKYVLKCFASGVWVCQKIHAKYLSIKSCCQFRPLGMPVGGDN